MIFGKWFNLGIISLIAALLIVPSPVIAEEAPPTGVISPGDVLNLDRCVSIALDRQPSLAAARSNVRAAESRIGQAQSAYFPQVSLSGGYSRIKSASASASSSSRLTNGGNEAFDQYSTSANLSQLIFDFGKTPNQVAIQRYGAEASGGDLGNTRALVILGVKQSYFGLLQTQRNLVVAREVVQQFELHLEQAKGFFDVGVKPRFDVTKAEADLSTAKLNLIRAENARKIALVTLNNSMGVPEAPDYTIEDSLAYVKKEITLAEALSAAFGNRPDLQASEARAKAAEEQVSFSWKGFFPVINGNAAYNRTGEKFLPPEGWNAGVTATWQIFNGFQTVHQVREAKANRDTAQSNYELLKQNITLEVQQAFLQLRQAEESIPTAELGVKQASENLEIATGRYNAGVGNPIEVTDAQITYVNAQTAYIQALYDYNVALASLDKAMGVK